MKNNKGSIIALIILIVITIALSIVLIINTNKKNATTIKVNVTDLTYVRDEESESIKRYTQDEFDAFYNDYTNGNLPLVYITEFVFDGVSMYKTYDLDDFIDEGNDTEVKTLEITAININTIGNVELSGEIIGGTILVNTNNIKGDINLLLNNVTIDTDSKKVPAIYVYNKDMNYIDHKVTINALEGTENYVTGGKFKKVSLIPSDDLDSYTNNYSGDSKNYYETYTNYYGVYTKTEIENILFAKLTADREDLADGDPYYFYKGSGAISSDIDLYFEGKGYLSVTSNKKEGIETKGNLTFSGGTGDYYITALDDCLNTTMDGNDYRNTLTIDVNSMKAIVSLDADEGDAIDSNGTLIINGGTIIALAKPGSDAGLDSSNGTIINGGTIIGTGDMYDEISSDSKQNFILLSFGERVSEDELITLLDSNDNVVFAYKTDRTYTNLVYSGSNLTDGTYYLYKDGNITGTNNNGLYTTVTYTKGTQLGYSSIGNPSGMMGGMFGNGGAPDMTQDRPEMPSDGNAMGEPPSGGRPSDIGRGGRPSGDMTPPDMETQSELGEGSILDSETLNSMRQWTDDQSSMANIKASSFTISGIANLFSGVATYVE